MLNIVRGPVLLLSVLLLASSTAGADEKVEFNRDIRPILADNCFACHGPDANKREAGLRLDKPEGAFAPADSGTVVIVPGKSAESELVGRITSEDESERMPPADSGKQLTERQIDLLRRWVDQGAEWQGHWAYLKPVRPPVPQSSATSAADSPIDLFVRAELEKQGLRAAPEADRITLIRRLYFDLTGLPPTAEEVETFLADRRSDAYEKLVDRVLASPHYGERMALYWLDLVRYADSAGYHSDNHRDIALYRDYVIAAFNNNKPFDRFTLEQLAGDLLPEVTNETRIASGYNKLLMTTEEGGAQAKEYLAKYAADRVRNASAVWLGATMGCCECHDHKFDPFSTKDFYSFAAFFADVKETAVGRQEQVAMPSPEQSQEVAGLDQQIAAARQVLATQTPELDAAQARWEATIKSQTPLWTVLKPESATATSGAELKILDDGSILAQGAVAAADRYTIVLPLDQQGITALRLEALTDPSLPGQGPGRAGNGNFVLSELQLSTVDRVDPAKVSPVALHNGSVDFSQDGFSAAAVIDGKPDTGWAVVPQVGKPHVAVFETQSPLGEAGGSKLNLVLEFNHGSNHVLGRFRLAVTSAQPPIQAASGIPPEISDLLAIDPAGRNQQQKDALATYFRTIAAELQEVRERLGQLEQAKAELVKSFPMTLVTVAVEPRIMRILPRGNWMDDSGEVVLPGVPAFLPALDVKDRRATRLDLAQWLVSRDNPLVARVFVNRLWKLVFGQGLVKSADDFGAQGTAPTHPELLDWLALELIESGWNVKHMLRLMVTSETYRQSSKADETLRQLDPENKWLARQSRFRIDAEMVRDNALAISGLLSRKIGGPSVKPYQPAGYWSYLNFPVRDWVHDHGANQYRRGLYTYWQRTFLHPSLAAFDAPSREECTVDRPRSNTPLQALVLLNDPTYVEAARVFAARIMEHGGSMPSERIDWAFRHAVSRPVRPQELKILDDLYRRHLQQYTADLPAAERLVKTGESPVPANLNVAELAAWTSVARAILNLHETMTRM